MGSPAIGLRRQTLKSRPTVRRVLLLHNYILSRIRADDGMFIKRLLERCIDLIDHAPSIGVGLNPPADTEDHARVAHFQAKRVNPSLWENTLNFF